jgi:myo-inositol-1-phosphate synthase
MSKIKIAIAGVGNCASSLLQGIDFYKDVDEKSGFVPGVTHNTICGYRIRDIECVAAFDIDKNKVGADLSQAIFVRPNCAEKFQTIHSNGIIVQKGPVLDGLGENLKKIITVDKNQKDTNVAKILRQQDVDILINFLPTGSKKATEHYADQAIKAKCGFINAIPEFIATSEVWEKKFSLAGLPLVGDDIKSQLGATTLHRALVDLFLKNGCRIDETHQSNIGGNTDFLNLIEASRAKTKIICKNEAIKSIIPYDTPVTVDIKSYKKGHDPTFGDAKQTKIHLEGKNFGSRPISIDVELHVEDSPNSSGVMIDVIRSMKIALDRNVSGVITPICTKYFKYAPIKCDDEVGHSDFLNFLRG